MRTRLTNGLIQSVAAAVLLFVIGVLGYMWIEKFNLVDAAYMTVITLSTVGFGEVTPLSMPGKIFTGAIIMMGVITIAVMFGTLTEYIVAGELAGTINLRRLMRKINAMQGHYIVCGVGRVGLQVAVELKNQGLPCVVIDMDSEMIDHCAELGIPGLEGDATLDETLRMAGINRAKGLVAALNSDAENVYVILSARKMNPDLTIVGRSTGEETSVKLEMAGANRVVSPYNMAGYRIVNQLTRPHVTFFLDTAMRSIGLNLLMDEIEIAEDSSLVSLSMSDAEIRTRTGANILAIMRGEKHEVVDWSPDLAFKPGDMLIVVGKPDELRALARLAGDMRFEPGD
jgi:voltage-gated potassium channel